MTRNTHGRRLGATLVEVAAVVVGGALVFALVGPLVAGNRLPGWNLGSAQNLSQIGQAAWQYGMDNDGLLPNYWWQAGPVDVIVDPDGTTTQKNPSTAMVAQQYQNTDILRRITGRISGPGGGSGKILYNLQTMPHRRYSHLPLQQYMGLAGDDPLFAAPADHNLLSWRADPLDVGALPSAGDSPWETNWSFKGTEVRQRWPYSSSYLPGIASWSPTEDEDNTYGLASGTSNLFSGSGQPTLGGTRFTDVVFPDKKVYYYEEFDRHQHMPRFMHYPEARPYQLMFDGSVQARYSYEANAGVDPLDPNDLQGDPYDYGPGDTYSYLHYTPFTNWPVWADGDPQRRLNLYYRWTYLGLGGIDFPAGRPKEVRNAHQAPGAVQKP